MSSAGTTWVAAGGLAQRAHGGEVCGRVRGVEGGEEECLRGLRQTHAGQLVDRLDRRTVHQFEEGGDVAVGHDPADGVAGGGSGGELGGQDELPRRLGLQRQGGPHDDAQ